MRSPRSALAAALLALAGLPGCGAEQERARNVVLISVDTLNAGVVNQLDAADTPYPHLGDLVSRSVVFTRAHSTASWTLPAHGSLMTGLYPDRHGATARHRRLAREVDTLAELLRAAGFETIGFGGGAYVDAAYGFSDGFDRYDDEIAEGAPHPERKIVRDGRFADRDELALFDRAIELLEQRADDDPPLFLFLQTYLVHDYFTLQPWVRAETQRKLLPRKYYLSCVIGTLACRDEDWSVLREIYAAEIEILDWGLGRLLQALERAGMRQDTLIVFVSDHGEGFEPERSRIHHGGRLDADLIRIPLLFSGPGIGAARSGVGVSIVDVMPTILDQLGLPVPKGLDGRSLRPILLREVPQTPRMLFASEYFYHWRSGHRKATRSMREEPFAIAAIRGNSWYVRGPEGEALYDMKADPEQRNNLAKSARLPAHFRRRTSARIGKYTPPLIRIQESDELRAHLEALGYLEGAEPE